MQLSLCPGSRIQVGKFQGHSPTQYIYLHSIYGVNKQGVDLEEAGEKHKK